MYIPKKLNAKFGVPLVNGPIVFGMKTASNMEENFQIFEGAFADMMADNCNDYSMLRVIDLDEWEMKGFFIVDYEGQKVVIRKHDITGINLVNKKAKETASVNAEDESIGDLMKMIEKMQLKISRLENVEPESSVKAKEEEKASIKEDIDAFSSGESPDVEAMAKAKAATAKKPKPSTAKKQKNGR